MSKPAEYLPLWDPITPHLVDFGLRRTQQPAGPILFTLAVWHSGSDHPVTCTKERDYAAVSPVSGHDSAQTVRRQLNARVDAERGAGP
jgi:hypothetical protein